jgi:hypothetical protein
VQVTLGLPGTLDPDDKRLGTTISRGLRTAGHGLLWSLNMLIVGLLFIGPWAFVGWVLYRMLWRKKAPAVAK